MPVSKRRLLSLSLLYGPNRVPASRLVSATLPWGFSNLNGLWDRPQVRAAFSTPLQTDPETVAFALAFGDNCLCSVAARPVHAWAETGLPKLLPRLLTV